jgi:hypothetical protein
MDDIAISHARDKKGDCVRYGEEPLRGWRFPAWDRMPAAALVQDPLSALLEAFFFSMMWLVQVLIT